jgi:hypothetical protein
MTFQFPALQVHDFITNGLQYKQLREQAEKQEKWLRINLASKFKSTFNFWKWVGWVEFTW